MNNYQEKYLKYKKKYLNSKQMTGGQPGSGNENLHRLIAGIQDFRDRIGPELSNKLKTYSSESDENRTATIELLSSDDLRDAENKMNYEKAIKKINNFFCLIEYKYHRNDAVILAAYDIDDNMHILLKNKLPRYFIIKYTKLSPQQKEKFVADIEKGRHALFAGHVLHLLGNLTDGEEDKLLEHLKVNPKAGLFELAEELITIRKCASRS